MCIPEKAEAPYYLINNKLELIYFIVFVPQSNRDNLYQYRREFERIPGRWRKLRDLCKNPGDVIILRLNF